MCPHATCSLSPSTAARAADTVLLAIAAMICSSSWCELEEPLISRQRASEHSMTSSYSGKAWNTRIWKLLDFALLKRNLVSFFDIEKPETAVSRWSRARMRTAKVVFCLPHSFFSAGMGENRLDVGEGKDVNLEEHCPRWKLHKQCIKYLGPKERETYEVIVEDSKLMYKLSRQIIDTTKSHKGIKWIFVLSTCKNLITETEGHIPALQLPCRGSYISCRETNCKEWNFEGSLASHSNGKPSPGAKVIDEDSTMFGECLTFCKKNLFAEGGEEEDELV
ncbi:hypothetical protein ABZP36_017530 [Zizania latifolia]